MIKFLGYVVKYKANTLKLARLEEELEAVKCDVMYEEKRATDKNNALRQIKRLIKNSRTEMKYGEASYRQLLRQIEEIIDDNVEKKFADEILGNSSTND